VAPGLLKEITVDVDSENRRGNTESGGSEISSSTIEEDLAALDAEIAAELDAEEAGETPKDEWYFIHTYSGMENKVKKNLEHRAESMGMTDRILQVVVPTETEIEIRNGVRKEVEKRVFPGYVLVNMILDEDSWYVVRNTPGVTGFVGMGNKPTPLSPDEVAKIMQRLEADEPRIKVNFQLGEQVRIMSGPFAEFNGVVDEIYPDKGKARVLVSFFNRETPVEVDFLQLEREA
jgi:transcriptional antiterminator NusG